eukprot:gnl/TRDRNA2_/TRDRNA2_136001_c1_seq1.p1 gnl/TRDRNA2_/TRDRNA2_136001_c1~~gnl/TRDRNA2_/TRDRNA2_136001_c1_seq1.p1  ORF type:complete len:350 (+),score=60.74 gnl/TRDRNA2_/TRDRNA2_136001_c1_seq1:27-1052(+)
MFDDPDFLAALETLKSTPEERAEKAKNEGNEAMRDGSKGGVLFAVKKYTKGLDERCKDKLLHATLLGNRAAAHTMLKNWGKALTDAKEALKFSVLPQASALRACRRGASAALELGKIPEARDLHTKAFEFLPEGTTSDADLQRILCGIAKLEEEEENKRRKEKLAEADASELATVLQQRKLVVRDFDDPHLRDQYLGPSSGARWWYDSEVDELHFPVLLLYPEPAMSDFIQDVAESDCLLPHLIEMFGENAENSPFWDRERKYRATDLELYVEMPKHGSRERVERVHANLPLIGQLLEKQARGYGIPGLPILLVVVKGSAYERQYFLNRLLTTHTPPVRIK